MAAAGAGLLFLCALHQELALQVAPGFAWIAVVAFAVLLVGAVAAPKSVPTVPARVEPPLRLRNGVVAVAVVGAIALAFVLALFHTRTVACAPGGWDAVGPSHAYCDDTTYVPKV